jgi:hypothetical protein
MIREFDPSNAHERVESYWSDTRYELHFSRGKIAYANVADYCRPVAQWDKEPLRLGRASFGVGRFRAPPGDMKSGVGSFASYKSSVDRGMLRVYLRVVPLAWVMVAAAILPVWDVVRRMRRTRAGRCAVCHYDLTGNTSGICPECGTAVGKAGA